MRPIIAAVALAALSACATKPPPPPTERPVREATACPELEVTLYFDPAATTLGASAQPVLTTVQETIARCQARFSPVSRVEITAHANRGMDGAAARSSADARAASIKAKFVELGVPARRIRTLPNRDTADDAEELLRRHANVKITFRVQD